MKCSFLSGTHALTCTANKDIPYTPSPFEVEEYCLSEKAKMCLYPILMLFGITHQPVREDLSKKRTPHSKAA